MPSKRIALLFAGFLVLLVATTWFVLQRTGASKAFVQRFLASQIRSEFELADAEVDLASGSLTLRGFEIKRPQAGAPPATAMETVRIGVDAGLAIRDVEIDGWHLDIDLIDDRATNLWDLLQLEPKADDEPAATPPAVTVTNSRVTLHTGRELPPLEFRELTLEVLPESPGSRELVLRGTATMTGGIALVLSGRGDPETEAFRVLVECAETEVDRELIRAFAPNVAQVLEEQGVAGTLHNASLWLESPGIAGGASAGNAPASPRAPGVVAGATFELRDLSATLSTFPYPIAGASARIAVSTLDEGTIRVHLDGTESSCPLTALATIRRAATAAPAWEFQLEAPALALDETLRRAVQPLDAMGRVWDALRPTAGVVALNLYVGSDPSADGFDPKEPFVIEATAQLRDVNGRYMGFPMSDGTRGASFPVPLQDVAGTVLVQDGVVVLRDLTGQLGPAAGGGDLRAEGRIDTRRDDNSHIDITSDAVRFHAGVRAAVGELLASEGDPDRGTNLWDSFAPEGRASLAVHLEDDSYRVDIRPLQANVSWREFPHPIGELSGLIRIEESGVALDLTGAAGSASLALDARIRDNAPDQHHTELLLKGSNLAFSAELRDAVTQFSPALGRQWEQLQPHGQTDLELVFWREQERGPAHYDMRLDLRGAGLQFVGLPVPVEDLTGTIHILGRDQESQLDVDRVAGIVAPPDAARGASILAQGSVRLLDGTVQSQEITAVIQDLPLTSGLAAALDAGDVFPNQVWDLLRPGGTVDCVFHRVQKQRRTQPSQRLQLTLRDVSSSAAILPGPATAIHGTVEVRDGQVSFEDLSASMRGVEIQCLDGSVTTDDVATTVRATVRSIGEFPVDDAWGNLLSGPFRDAYLARRIRGQARINELKLGFRFPHQNPEAFRTEVTGQFAIGDASLDLGARVESLVGIVQIDDGVFDQSEGRLDGLARDIDFSLLGHPIQEFSGRFRADSEGVSFREVNFSIHDGQVRATPGAEPALDYRFVGDGILRADLTLENLTLSRLLRASGQTGTPYRGIVGGHVKLDRLAGGNFLEMIASGELRVVDADLGTVPVFTAIYEYVAPDRRPKFDEASVRFSIRDREVAFEDCAVGSSFLGVTGAGTLSLDGYVDMVLRAENLIPGNAWLIVPGVINLITKNVVRFHVYGHLRTVKARPRFLFQGDPGYQYIAPIPPPRRVRTHPGF